MNLELKIPPPVVALLLAGAMWLLSTAMPRVDTPAALRIGTALAIAAAGGAFSLAGMLAFRRAKTTVNPLRNSSPVLRNRDELGVFFFWGRASALAGAACRQAVVSASGNASVPDVAVLAGFGGTFPARTAARFTDPVDHPATALRTMSGRETAILNRAFAAVDG